MLRTLPAILVSTVVFLFTGCGRDHQEQDAGANATQAKVEEESQELTAETAKRALLEMDGRQIRPGVIVPLPKDEPIRIVTADEIAIGRYHCKLKEKTFQASTFYPNAPRHKFNEVSGVFERDAEGKWVAKVTESSSGH